MASPGGASFRVALLFTAATAVSAVRPPPADIPANTTCSGGAPSLPGGDKKLKGGALTFATVPAPQLVPFPASLQARPSYMTLAGCVIHVSEPSLLPLGNLLASEVLAATNGAVTLPVGGTDLAGKVIQLALSGEVYASDLDAYSLSITSGSASLTAPSYAGLVAATATLLQSVELSVGFCTHQMIDFTLHMKQMYTENDGFYAITQGDADSLPPTKSNCSTHAVWRLPALVLRISIQMPETFLIFD